jgi:hypothetical protein
LSSFLLIFLHQTRFLDNSLGLNVRFTDHTRWFNFVFNEIALIEYRTLVYATKFHKRHLRQVSQ